MGLLSVAIAVGCVSGAMALLVAHDARTEVIITEKEAETRKAMYQMEDDYRRIMRDMGYNVLIVHKDQDIAAMQRDGAPNTFMPDDYAQRLAEGGVKTLNHLLPVLQIRTQWREKDAEIIVAGVRGQVPIAHRRREGGGPGPDGTPIMTPVPRGAADVGHALAEQYGLDAGDEFLLNGVALRVNKRLPRRGAQEDVTLWVHLDQAQEWFDMPGRINGIFALECICEAESLGKVSNDVRRILPDTQVFEFSSLVKSRALARARAADAHREAVESERRNRIALREERKRMTLAIVPLAVAGAALWIFLLTVANVRERRYEIGILRALGFSAWKLIALFLLRVIFMAVAGAFFGYIIGAITGAFGGGGVSGAAVGAVVRPLPLVLAILAAATLSCMAAWLPTLQAAAQDPAEILKEIT